MLNGVTSVLEDALITINIGDSRSRTDGVHVGGVVDFQGFLFLIKDFTEILGVDKKAVLALLYADFVVFSSSVVSDLQEVSFHHFDRLWSQGEFYIS